MAIRNSVSKTDVFNMSVCNDHVPPEFGLVCFDCPTLRCSHSGLIVKNRSGVNLGTVKVIA